MADGGLPSIGMAATPCQHSAVEAVLAGLKHGDIGRIAGTGTHRHRGGGTAGGDGVGTAWRREIARRPDRAKRVPAFGRLNANCDPTCAFRGGPARSNLMIETKGDAVERN